MKRLMHVLIGILVFGQNYAQSPEIEYALFNLPNVIFKPLDTPDSYSSAYELRIKQPIDHGDPDKGYFYQRAFLSHISSDKPMVLVTEGYDQSRNRISELALLLNTNQLVVEHRYFGKSIPDEMDYQYLNLKQTTADLHNINTIFKEVYKSKWLSTGISKGGQTTLYYRYFYPNDVAVSIPYVAPFSLDLPDKRINNFLDTIGTEACRNKLRNVQHKILKNRQSVLDYLRWYSYGASLNFSYLNFEEAFEYMVLEYPFAFWQWGYNCEDIPDTSQTADQLLVHMLNISDIEFFSDKDIVKYGSHYYQAATEMGYYGYETKHFKGLLKALHGDPMPLATFTPNKMKLKYDATLAWRAYKWLQDEGDRIIYINGGTDTWSATSIPPSEGRESLWFYLKDSDHSEARIKNMTIKEKELLYQKLEEWLQIEVDDKWLVNWRD